MQRNKSSSPAAPPLPNATSGQQPHQVCAACSHQRKKCSETCKLAPYLLPINRKSHFAALQHVYGVSNLTKLLRSAAVHDNSTKEGKPADPNRAHENRLSAVESLSWEAEVRLRDPVLGSYGLVRTLLREKDECLHENLMLRREVESLQYHLAVLWNNGHQGTGVAPIAPNSNSGGGTDKGGWPQWIYDPVTGEYLQKSYEFGDQVLPRDH